MRVLHVIPSLSPSQGGPSVALPAMAQALTDQGVEVDVVTTDDDGAGRRMADVLCGTAEMRCGFRIFYFPKQTEFYKVSLPMMAWLTRHVRDYDVVHVHAVFSFASLAAGWAAAMQGVPFIVRPLGVLNAWGMGNRRRWLKGLSFRLMDKPMLDRAASMHYTSEEEASEAGRLLLRAPAAVIPLGIAMGPFADLQNPSTGRDQATVLFMSRLDPKKGIELLLQAFAKLAEKNAEATLVIAGKGEAHYVSRLQAMADGLGLSKRVTWAGFLGPAEKKQALATATVFVLPSYSENFGIALLEAMAAGLPCVATDQVALAVAAGRHGAVKVIGCNVEELEQALQMLLADGELRNRLGGCAAEVARRDYSLEGMADALRALYQRAASRGADHHNHHG